MSDISHLFCEGDLSATLATHGAQACQKVDAIPKEQFMASRVDDLVKHVSSQLVVQPLTLHENSMTRDQKEAHIDVSGLPGRSTWGGDPCIVPEVQVFSIT